MEPESIKREEEEAKDRIVRMPVFKGSLKGKNHRKQDRGIGRGIFYQMMKWVNWSLWSLPAPKL